MVEGGGKRAKNDLKLPISLCDALYHRVSISIVLPPLPPSLKLGEFLIFEIWTKREVMKKIAQK